MSLCKTPPHPQTLCSLPSYDTLIFSPKYFLHSHNMLYTAPVQSVQQMGRGQNLVTTARKAAGLPKAPQVLPWATAIENILCAEGIFKDLSSYRLRDAVPHQWSCITSPFTLSLGWMASCSEHRLSSRLDKAIQNIHTYIIIHYPAGICWSLSPANIGKRQELQRWTGLKLIVVQLDTTHSHSHNLVSNWLKNACFFFY